MAEMRRIDRAIIALHDYGTREGATAHSVKAALRNDGFTLDEIMAAIDEMSNPTNPKGEQE